MGESDLMSKSRLREDELPPCPECGSRMEFIDGLAVEDRRIACTRCPVFTNESAVCETPRAQ